MKLRDAIKRVVKRSPWTVIGFNARREEIARRVIPTLPRNTYDLLNEIMTIDPCIVEVVLQAFDGEITEAMERPEVMLSVHYTRAFPGDLRADDGVQRRMMRGMTTAHLGIDYDPKFTAEEMNSIMHAAKMEAARILRCRAKKTKRVRHTKARTL